MADQLTDRIAEVLRDHHHWDYAGDLACQCGESFALNEPDAGVGVQAWASHVAEAVVTALPELDLTARLKAFARDCVTHGDMTPSGEQMLLRILNGCGGWMPSEMGWLDASPKQ